MNEGLMEEKKVKGRKRHIVTDTQGHILQVTVHAANIHDTIAGCKVFEIAQRKYPSIKGVCTDAGYRRTFQDFVQIKLKKTVLISVRTTHKWTILAKRWVVERTLSWLGHFRRLSKDYEITINSAENNIMIAHSMTLLSRLE